MPTGAETPMARPLTGAGPSRAAGQGPRSHVRQAETTLTSIFAETSSCRRTRTV